VAFPCLFACDSIGLSFSVLANVKVLITGADGLLAYALAEAVPGKVELVGLRHAEFDLTKPDQMREQLRAHRPGVVINTAAYNMVDRCEVERELSWAINAIGPQTLGELCAEIGCQLVHYGTDYVFDGSKGEAYAEADAPNPVNHYAAGKLAGESAVLRGAGNLVLRVSWLFGWHPTQSKSYVHTVLNQVRKNQDLKATTDQSSVPTYVPDLARWTFELIEGGATGLWNAVNDEGLSRFQWTKVIVDEITRLGLPGVTVEPVTTAYFNPTMRRPTYTVLANKKLSTFLGRPLGSWKRGLAELLAKELKS
jgi:dTDP-4-dehydrorhamnose reductase